MRKFKPNTSTFKMKGYSYPGESPLNQNYGKHHKSGKLKKTEIGPKTKPMVDKDGDGIPLGVDADDNDAMVKTTDKRKPVESDAKPKSNIKPGKPVEKESEVIQMPNPNVKPPGYGLDR